MKKLLKWVLPAFIGIVPALGMNEPVGEIKDPFFTKSGTAVSVRMAIESGDNVMLMVDATDENARTESKKVVADCADDGWEMNDEDLTYQQKVIAQVVCGNELLERAYTKRKKTSYDILKPTTEVNLFGDTALTDAELPLEQIVEICTQTVYKRPDGKEIEKRGATTNKAVALALLDGKRVKSSELFQVLPLEKSVNVVKVVSQEANVEVGEEILLAAPVIYQLILKEKSVPQAMFYRCYEHKNETSNQGFKVKTQLRHWYEHYNVTNVTREIYKVLKDGQEVLYLTGTTETLLRLNGRDTGRTNQPNCTPLGNAFPPNSRVVQ